MLCAYPFRSRWGREQSLRLHRYWRGNSWFRDCHTAHRRSSSSCLSYRSRRDVSIVFLLSWTKLRAGCPWSDTTGGPATSYIQVPFLVSGSLNSIYDWNYTTTPQSGLNDRAMAYPRGFVLGGSSSISKLLVSVVFFTLLTNPFLRLHGVYPWVFWRLRSSRNYIWWFWLEMVEYFQEVRT